jgi:hypothetical protein
MNHEILASPSESSLSTFGGHAAIAVLMIMDLGIWLGNCHHFVDIKDL